MSFWQDVRDIKVGYIIFVGVCVLGGKAVFDNVIDDDGVVSLGSSSSWEEQQEYNRIELERMLSDGVTDEMTKQRFIERLGAPEYTQTFDNGTEILMYRTRHAYSDGVTNRKETLPLIFTDGVLVGYTFSENWAGSDEASVAADDLDTQENTRETILSLAAGQPTYEVIAQLGEPDFRDYPGENYEVLSYQTNLKDPGSEASERNETTALLFFQNELVGKQVGVMPTSSRDG